MRNDIKRQLSDQAGWGNIYSWPLIWVRTPSLFNCWSVAEIPASIEKRHSTNLFNFILKVLLLRHTEASDCPKQTNSPLLSPWRCRGWGDQTFQSIGTNRFISSPSPLGTRTCLLNYFLPLSLAAFHTTLQQPATNNNVPVFRPPPRSPAVSTRAYVLFSFLEQAILSPAKKNL